jgi:hypothetical protein
LGNKAGIETMSFIATQEHISMKPLYAVFSKTVWSGIQRNIFTRRHVDTIGSYCTYTVTEERGVTVVIVLEYPVAMHQLSHGKVGVANHA